MTPRREAAVLLAVFLVVFVVHVRSPVMTSFDSRWSVYLAMSLVRQGNLDLDEYADLVRREEYYGVERVGGHLVSGFPLGTPLLAVPFVLVADRGAAWLLGVDFDQRLRLDPDLHRRAERFVASVLVAATAVVVYLIGRLVLQRSGSAVLLALVFAFATPAWSTASRALWQHGPSMLMLAIALLLLLRARTQPRLAGFASLPLVFAWVVRPTNAISLVVLTLYVAWRHRPALPGYLFWGALLALPFLLGSLAVYGAPLPPYYLPSRIGAAATLGEALLGNLVSPGRGLFVFTPVLLFAVAGAVARLRTPDGDGLDAALVAIVGLHWLAISSFPHWWAGHSYGPRFFTDMVPYLVYFLVPVLAALEQARGGRRAALAGGLAAALAASVYVHHRGATSRYADEWNASPVDVDVQPSRVWDWSDLQFLRGRPAGAPRRAGKRAISG